jgi:hypothetical protein
MLGAILFSSGLAEFELYPEISVIDTVKRYCKSLLEDGIMTMMTILNGSPSSITALTHTSDNFHFSILNSLWLIVSLEVPCYLGVLIARVFV